MMRSNIFYSFPTTPFLIRKDYLPFAATRRTLLYKFPSQFVYCHFLASFKIPSTQSSYFAKSLLRSSNVSPSLDAQYTTSGAATFLRVPTSFQRVSGATIRNELNLSPV